MTPLEHLNQLRFQDSKAKFPLTPDHHRVSFFKPYTDKNEKGLKKMIQDFCKFTGNFAEPINNRGFRIDERQVVENVIGQMKTIGSVRWAKSSQEKGTADMQARIKTPGSKYAIPIAIEIKMPGDRQSYDQKRYQEKIESSGGLYWIVSNFSEFYQKYNELQNP